MPTKAEKQHMDRVAALGCLVCFQPAEIHHIRAGQGGARRASHFKVLPLCGRHHRTGGRGVAFHAGEDIWQQKYGMELDLLATVRQRLDALDRKASPFFSIAEG